MICAAKENEVRFIMKIIVQSNNLAVPRELVHIRRRVSRWRRRALLSRRGAVPEWSNMCPSKAVVLGHLNTTQSNGRTGIPRPFHENLELPLFLPH